VRAGSDDLVNNILDRDDSIFAQIFFDDDVIGQRNSLFVDLSISSLVDQLPDGLEVGFPIGDVRLDKQEHLSSSFGDFDEHAIIDLQQPEQLKDFSRFGSDFVDTSQSNNEEDLWFSRDIEIASGLGASA